MSKHINQATRVAKIIAVATSLAVLCEPVYANLTLQIDPETGTAQIKNMSSGPITWNSYRITSVTSSLNATGWNPISNGNELTDQFPPGDGTGNGWEVAPNPNDGELVEWYLNNNSTLNPTQTLFLGNAFNPTAAHDVAFRYTMVDLTLQTGIVEYVPITPPAGIIGDYNENGVVDAADYVAWRRNLNQPVTLPNDSTPGAVTEADYNAWRTNFGKTSAGAVLVAGTSIPEPATYALVLLALIKVRFRSARPQ